MKTLLKGLSIGLFIILVIGVLFCIYILNAPPVAKPAAPKFQVHTKTPVRGRPTVNSKPRVYTKDVYLFSIDTMYISNLNTGIFSSGLLFTVALGQRSRYTAALLDKELKTVFNWQKMFADSASEIKLNSRSTTIKVLESGNNWVLTDSTGAGYIVQKVKDNLEIYLPDLQAAFTANNTIFSTDVELTVENPGKQWLIKDSKARQGYEIRKSGEKLHVYQQSKFPIETFLFNVDLASEAALKEDKFSPELREEFKQKQIPLSRNAKLLTGKDDVGWQIIDGSQKYNLQNEYGWLNVYLDLESKWIFIRVSNTIKGWVPSERGTITLSPPPELSSRQQLKKKMVAFIEKVKITVGISEKPDQDQIPEQPNQTPEQPK